MSKKDRKQRKKSTARRRADQHSSGYETTILKIPEGLSFYKLEKGTHIIDIVPYTVGAGNPFADEGELHYERTFHIYRSIGIEEKSYISSSKTFGKPDYIQEWRNTESKNPDVDSDTLKQFAPKERQIFLVYDHSEPEKGLKIWECSWFLFGKALDSRISNSDDEDGWDLFYYTDDDGMSLKLTVEEEIGGGYKFNKVTGIDFRKRKKPLPDEIINHDICLDALLIETKYEDLKRIFKGGDAKEDEDKTSSDDNEPEETDDMDDEGFPDEKTEPEKKKEKKKEISTAKDKGLSKGDDVTYDGEKYAIFKISKDGTSLALVDDDGEIVKAIGVDEVTLVEVDEPEANDEPEKSDKSSDDDEWDEWDD